MTLEAGTGRPRGCCFRRSCGCRSESDCGLTDTSHPPHTPHLPPNPNSSCQACIWSNRHTKKHLEAQHGIQHPPLTASGRSLRLHRSALSRSHVEVIGSAHTGQPTPANLKESASSQCVSLRAWLAWLASILHVRETTKRCKLLQAAGEPSHVVEAGPFPREW